MKNALALYIEALAAAADRSGALPAKAATPEALRPVFDSLRAEIADALEALQLDAVSAQILASAPSVRAAVSTVEPLNPEPPQPSPKLLALNSSLLPLSSPSIPAALAKLRAKTPVPSSLRSADWAAVPVQIREVSQFSAAVESARVMSAIQSRLEANLSADFTQPKGREAFLRDMRAVMEAEGVGWESVKEGSLLNPRANSRLGLIYDQQTRSARGYAARKIAMDPDMLDAVPAQELVRESAAKTPRDWTQRFRAAGGSLRSGRLAALKTDPVWTSLSRFGTPWPPFDFGSHMGLRDLLRPEAEALGLLTPADTLTPDPVPDYTATAVASSSDISDTLLPFLEAAFGSRLSVSGSTLSLLPQLLAINS